MKKIKYVFLLFMVMMFPMVTNAETYSIAETDVTITIDELSWCVFTRDNIKDNQTLIGLGSSYEHMDNLMKKNNIYMDAVLFRDTEPNENLEFFIRVIDIEEDVGNLHTYSESEINEFGKGLMDSGRFNMDSFKIYGDKYKYIEFEYTDLGYNIYQFYTVINGKGYNFTIQKINEITESEKTLIKNIINTVEFKIDEYYETPIGTENKDSIKTGAIRGGIIGGIVGLIGALVAKKKKGKEQKNTTQNQDMNNISNMAQTNNNQVNDINNQNNNFMM